MGYTALVIVHRRSISSSIYLHNLKTKQRVHKPSFHPTLMPDGPTLKEGNKKVSI